MTGADLLFQLRTFRDSLLRPAGAPPRPSRWALASDALLAVALAAVTVIAASRGITDAHRAPGPGLPLVGVLEPPIDFRQRVFAEQPTQWMWALLATLPLALRRRSPLAAFWLVLAGTRFLSPGGSADDATRLVLIALVVAGYSAVVHSPYRRASVLSLLLGAIVVLTHNDGVVPPLTPKLLPFVLLFGGALVVNARGLWEQRAKELEEQQADLTRRAVEQERARIAAELHDVVTHHVAVMVVQAGAARKIMATSPDLAREALLTVESGGRAAMAELRHVMGLLTMTSQGPDGGGDHGGGPGADGPLARAVDLAPQPGLEQTDALVERLRAAGMRIEVRREGLPVGLPGGASLAAYRVVQEALTNAMKHASGAEVTVRIAYATGSVRIDVSDGGGRATPEAAHGSGRGLAGLRKRLAVYGGTLHAERRLSGGYRVTAVVPVESGVTG